MTDISTLEWVAYPSDTLNTNILNELNALPVVSKNILQVNSGLCRYSYEVQGGISEKNIRQVYEYRSKYLEVRTSCVLDSKYDIVAYLPHLKVIAMAWLSNLLDTCITKILTDIQSPHPDSQKILVHLKPLSKKDTPIYSDKSIPVLDDYRNYMFLSVDPLVFYLEPEFLTVDNQKLPIKLIPYTNISLVRLPEDWDKLSTSARTEFFRSVDEARGDLLGIRSRGTFCISYKNIEDKHIIMMLAELWNFEVMEYTANDPIGSFPYRGPSLGGEGREGRQNKLSDILVLQTLHKLKPFFPTNFYNIPTECSKIQEAGLDVSLSGEINGLNISAKVIMDWFNHNIDLIKNDNLPEYTLYGLWQLYSDDIMPNIIAVATLVYIQLFPYYGRSVKVGSDGGIRGTFLSVDELILYANSLRDQMSVYVGEEGSTSIAVTDMETAFNYRLQNSQVPSLIVEYENVTYVVFFEKDFHPSSETHPMLSLIYPQVTDKYGWSDFVYQDIKVRGVVPKMKKLHRSKPAPDYHIIVQTQDNKTYYVFVRDEHKKYEDDTDLYLGYIFNTSDNINTITDRLQDKWNRGKILDLFANTFLKITGTLPLWVNINSLQGIYDSK